MDKNALVIEEIDAGAKLIRRFQDHMSVDTAFWLNPSEDGAWVLYIATPRMDVAKYDLGFAKCTSMARIALSRLVEK